MTTKAGSFRFRFGMCVRALFPVLKNHVMRSRGVTCEKGILMSSWMNFEGLGIVARTSDVAALLFYKHSALFNCIYRSIA